MGGLARTISAILLIAPSWCLANEPPVSGLVFWLDASDLDANDATPNPEPATPVSSWTDRVGGITLEKHVGAPIPELGRISTAEHGDLPAVFFDGAAFLRAEVDSDASPWLDDSSGSIVLVFDAEHAGEGYAFEVGGGGAMVGTHIFEGHPSIAGGLGIQSLGGAFGNNYYSGTRSVADGDLHHGIITSDGSSWSFFVDGEGPLSTASLAGSNTGDWYGGLPAAEYLSLGQYSDGSGEPEGFGHRGHIAEILVYDHALDVDERRSVSAYVSEKYGTRPVDPPEPPDPPDDADQVADTVFSIDRGFFIEPVDVEITTLTEGATIRYTTDGSAPSSTHGTIYDGPVRIDPDTTEPRRGAFTLRAIAYLEGFRPTNVDTQTYIFPEAVVRQPRRPQGAPTSWGVVGADYEMDPNVVDSPTYRETIVDDLQTIPAISLVLDMDDLFGSRGIYSNPRREGVSWERAGSFEVIHPDGSDGTQENCGLRMFGGGGRAEHYGKHSFRVLFKSGYGATKLRYALFPDSPIDRFDTLVLRCTTDLGYVDPDGGKRRRGLYLRDQWCHDTARAMGQLGAHGRFVHVYLNGIYWGLYDLMERPDASFMASYEGGEKEDYDATNRTELVDGSLDSFERAVALANAGLTSSAAYDEFRAWVDVENLADFFINNFYNGNIDYPGQNGNNWRTTRRREPGAGLKVFVWDAEHTLADGHVSTSVEFDGVSSVRDHDNNPARLFSRVRQNREFRVLFGDRVHRHFFHGGALTTVSTTTRFRALADQIERAIIGESARWGDWRGDPEITQAHWLAERDRLLREYFPRRTEVVLAQLVRNGLYPDVDAPTFSRHGGRVPRGFRLTADVPRGRILYTVDGTDPRLPGGEIAPTAREIGAGFGGELDRRLVADGADARVLVPPNGDLGLSWTAVDFDDATWRSGRTGVGFDTGTDFDDLVRTDLERSMHNRHASVYVRIEFDLDDVRISSLTLRMKYDDGFVAYLNGTETLAVNAPESPQWNSQATRSHLDPQAIVFEDFDISLATGLLDPGRNVLALHGLNLRASNSDLLLLPELRATVTDDGGDGIPLGETTTVVRARTLDGDEWSALNAATFVPDDQDLRVTELMYNPPDVDVGEFDDEEFEFIELQNVNDRPLSLVGVEIEGGVRFAFSGSDVEELAPREIVLVVENREAFESRYDSEGLKIAGEYTGRLSNGGERIVVRDAVGVILQDFTYSDEWHAATDGLGFSLVVRDPDQAPELWNDPHGWHDSRVEFGTPGESTTTSEARQLPGDVNQDGAMDLSDAVRLLLILFSGVEQLPCEGDLGSDGNRTILDINGDDSVDISDAVAQLAYLFQGGTPPSRGTRCILVMHCADRCAAENLEK